VEGDHSRESRWALGILGIAAAVGARAGVVTLPFDRPEGPMLWNLARVAGVVAYLALTGTVALGLLVSTGALDRWIARARSLELHRWLSSVMLALLAAARPGPRRRSTGALRPARPARPLPRALPALLAVGLGVLALHLAIVVIASGPLRARLGPRLWRALHLLSFPSFFPSSRPMGSWRAATRIAWGCARSS
jgi:hypothetical protein